MEADVVIIGGGPAGMACALRLSQLIDAHNDKLALKSSPLPPISKENIYVLEKAREAGQHCLSGALLDPRSMRELLPGFESEAPIDAEVTKESVYFLTEKGHHKLPIVPPPLRDHGNYVISINKFVKWMAAKVEAAGITIFTGFAGSELLFDQDGVAGVRTDDKGVDKEGNPKANFEPGYDLHSKITIMAEGARGSCTKQLIERFHLESPEHAQTYGVGIKELWESSSRPGGERGSDLHPGLSPHQPGVWRSMDLRHLGHTAFRRLRGWTELSGSTDRPAPRISVVQATRFGAAPSRGRKDGALRRQEPTLRRMAYDAKTGRQGLDDPG